MTAIELDPVLDRYGKEFLILDFNHLFFAATLREEIWLLRRRNDPALLASILAAARELPIHGVAPDRDLATYSGGEQAVLACLLAIALIRANGVRGVKVLLFNLMDSLSEQSRSRLAVHFADSRAAQGTRFFVNQGERIEAVP